MDLKEILTGTVNIILGRITSDNEAELLDFKEEIDNAVKSGLITKAEAAELIQSRNAQNEKAKAMEKKQMSSIALEDSIRDKRLEKTEKEIKEEDRVEKEEEEEKRRKNNVLEQTRKETSKEQNKNSNDLRSKLNKAMELDEIFDEPKKDLERDSKN